MVRVLCLEIAKELLLLLLDSVSRRRRREVELLLVVVESIKGALLLERGRIIQASIVLVILGRRPIARFSPFSRDSLGRHDWTTQQHCIDRDLSLSRRESKERKRTIEQKKRSETLSRVHSFLVGKEALKGSTGRHARHRYSHTNTLALEDERNARSLRSLLRTREHTALMMMNEAKPKKKARKKAKKNEDEDVICVVEYVLLCKAALQINSICIHSFIHVGFKARCVCIHINGFAPCLAMAAVAVLWLRSTNFHPNLVQFPLDFKGEKAAAVAARIHCEKCSLSLVNLSPQQDIFGRGKLNARHAKRTKAHIDSPIWVVLGCLNFSNGGRHDGDRSMGS
ncbi:uncharacterized protein LOC112347332 [Selaginella moellendorffii]|uniref:uncharacterized protein LOC112347332 n=1 Tax=Selaginella moellendorffii TaxID=88036 RepID=UPI000D1D0359|nr:uncharacterized protein LOC112347332 [Selaginella moellendorffii]|eukprot:XP_024533806.1 uncharacterized protein LOC112347332 [Selaginella moellendorffii]